MQSIAILTSTLGAGGAEKQAALLAQVLFHKYDVHFVALYGESEKSDFVVNILDKAGVNVYPLTGSLRQKLKSYAKILRENKVCYAFNYLTQPNFWGSIVERWCGVPRIYNGIRNTDLEVYKNVLEWFSHNFIATGTIFNCYSGEDAFRNRGFIKSKCITIPNCFAEISEPTQHKISKKIRIITVGRFHPQKDYETAIKTIALLKQKHSNIVFDLCGYGTLENQIREWVKQYSVEDVVEFHIKPNNIPKLLQQADIYLSTSLFEGTSNSIMEAMNWSLPVVATNVGDNKYLVKEGVNGHLHSIGDVKGLATSLNRLSKDVTLRNKMGSNGNSILKENYSMEIFEKRYIKLLENA